MPKGNRKTTNQLLEEVEGVPELGVRSTPESARKAEKKAKRDEAKRIEKANRRYTVLYVVIAIVVFFLGLLVIAFMNLWIRGEFRI